MDKKELRTELIRKRNEIPPAKRTERSAAICRGIFDLLIKHFGDRKDINIAAYYPLGSEVDVRMLYDIFEKAEWKLCLPVMIKAPERSEMEFFFIPYKTAKEGKEDFLSKPAKAIDHDSEALKQYIKASPGEIDAIVVPMVGFTSENIRMGYGGGNYDRYLPNMRKDAFIVGAAFEEQRSEEIIAEKHDFTLTHIVTA